MAQADEGFLDEVVAEHGDPEDGEVTLRAAIEQRQGAPCKAYQDVCL